MKTTLILFLYILTSVYTTSYYFTGVGLDESVLYHIGTGIGGAGIENDLIPLVVLVLCTTGLYFLIIYIMRKVRFFKTIVILCILFHPINFNIYNMFGGFGGGTDIAFAGTAIEKIQEDNQKNIVMIYLESYEYEHYLKYGKRMQSIPKTLYTNVHEAMGTNWTIAGMVASQCGVPLVGSISAGQTTQFLTKIHCLSDRLHLSGYDNHYIAGADIEFANKGNFYRSHNYKTVMGYKELGYTDIPHDWGIYDLDLLDTVYNKFIQYSENGTPFMLTTLTLDTHGNNGELSPGCGNDYGDIRDAYICTDRLVSGFINNIRNSEYGDNTMVIVLSDHLAMNHNPTVSYLGQDRRNLFFIVGGGDVVDRDMTVFDIGPTVLDILGGDNRIGIGISSNSNRKNLIESYNDFNGVLRAHKSLFNKLW